MPTSAPPRDFTWIGHGLALMLMGVALCLHLSWGALDHTPPHDDDASLYMMSLCVDELLDSPGLPHPETIRRCLPTAPYPPLIPLIAAFHYRWWGDRSVQTAVASLWMWLPLAMGALYVGVFRTAGVLPGLAAMCLGPILMYSLGLRQAFYTEPAVAALAAASVTALSWSQGFTRLWPSFFLGIFLGLGLLAKWSFGFFLGPPMVLAVVLCLYRLGTSPGVGLVAVAAGLLAAVLQLLDAAGKLQGGGLAGILVGTLGVMGLTVVGLLRPGWLKEGLPGLGGLGLTVLVTVMLAGPWYLFTLRKMQIFLSSNTSFAYAGDPMGLTESWPFYPAVVMDLLWTPVLLLVGLGILRALLPGRPPLLGWSLISFAAGLLVLASLPYRNARYLMAGITLLVPVATLALTSPSLLRTGVSGLLLFLSGFAQVGWIRLTAGGQPWPLPLDHQGEPPPVLFGNFRKDIDVARDVVTHPRWRLDLVGEVPRLEVFPTRRLISALAEASGPGVPWFVLVVDRTRTLNADAFWAESRARRGPDGVRIMGEVPEPTEESIRLRLLQTLPRSANLDGGYPANLFIATVTTLRGVEAHSLEGLELEAKLYELGFRNILALPIPPLVDSQVHLWQHHKPAPALPFAPPRVDSGGTFYPAYSAPIAPNSPTTR